MIIIIIIIVMIMIMIIKIYNNNNHKNSNNNLSIVIIISTRDLFPPGSASRGRPPTGSVLDAADHVGLVCYSIVY